MCDPALVTIETFDAGPLRSGFATQPWNRIVWPWDDVAPESSHPTVWDAATARRIPGVGRALQLHTGMVKQMAMNAFRGVTPLPRPGVLEQPDPNRGRAWFEQVQIEDYLLNGNAVSYVTDFDAAGRPASLAHVPANWLVTLWDPRLPADLAYAPAWDPAHPLDPSRVVHVRRGSDPWCPARGIGVVEEYIRTLDRVGREEEYQRESMSKSAVPSVAVITPNPRLGEDEATNAGDKFMERYGGSGRRPGPIPAGTQVIPLSWSPSDSQLVEARQASLTDIANIFNLDGYWLGAPNSAMTYKSPGPMYTNLLRVTIEPVLADFEDIWSQFLLPRGQRVVFDRRRVVRDDMASMILTLKLAVETGLMTRDEARVFLDLPTLGLSIPQVGVLQPALGEPDDAQLIADDSAGGGTDPAPGG